jgi:hypothetical protein
VVIVGDVVVGVAAGNAVSEVNVEALDNADLGKFISVNSLGTIDFNALVTHWCNASL